MSDYPSLLFLVLQALVTALIAAAPLLVITLGWGLFLSVSDLVLAAVAFLAFALASFLAFALFEGVWAKSMFGPLSGARSSIIGGVGVTIGMVWSRIGSTEGRARLQREPLWSFAASFLAGAFWGGIWRLSGWSLESMGMLRDG